MAIQTLGQRYEAGDTLGQGGMARVVAGYDRVLARPVAIKLLRDDIAADPAARERFLHEARAAASLRHPNAVTVYDTGTQGTTPYIVMELVEGTTLAGELAEHGQMDPAEAVRVARGVLSALGAAHAQGLVHRDIKPGNVLLPPGGPVKLADFGIAKGVADSARNLTVTGQVVGTPGYLSPEQVAGRPSTPRSDIYSVGVLLYEMLAGQPPFTGDSALAVALAHTRDPVPPLDGRRRGLDPTLVAAVHKALAKDPADRFADAGQFASALDRPPQRQATSVAPRPGPALAPVARGRHRPVGLLWVAGVLAVLVGLTVAALALDRPGAPTGGDLSARQQSGSRPAGGQPTASAPQQPAQTPPTEPSPTTVEGLLASLAQDPGAFGERGPDLLDELRDVQALRGSEQSEGAAEVLADVGKWVADGELDRRAGRLAVSYLHPLTVGPPEPQERSKGDGKDDEGKDEDGDD